MRCAEGIDDLYYFDELTACVVEISELCGCNGKINDLSMWL